MDPVARYVQIKSALFLKGLSFAAVDRQFELPRGSAHAATREPNPRGEAALAEVLALEPRVLWPERYDACGQRLEPQPLENYRRPQTMRQRRNSRAA